MKNHTSFNYEYAYSYCKKIVLSHYENFPVGSILVPKKSRKHFYAVYAFARKADDIADSGILHQVQKLELLNQFEDQLNTIDKGELSQLNNDTAQIFIALSNTIEELSITTEEFRKLLTAFKQDSVKSRYVEFEELLKYSENSANPIGHLVLNIFGYHKEADKSLFHCSDRICTALQLTNFWQDAGEDLKIDRVYIPETDMKNTGYSYEKLFKKVENNEFVDIMKNLISKTEKLFDEGRGIIDYTSGRLRLELKATISGGEEILKMIKKIDYKVLNKRVTLSSFTKTKLFFKILFCRI
ncbi:MAG: Hydroxysqualene synthase [Ignavibacteria bacterium]|nr:Hydroxysqualene synthase [Ignavibacteria bacterium]